MIGPDSNTGSCNLPRNPYPDIPMPQKPYRDPGSRPWRHLPALAAASLLAGLSSSLTVSAGDGEGSLPASPPAQLFPRKNNLRTVPVITNRMKHNAKRPVGVYKGERGTARHGSCTVSRTPIPGLQPLADTVSFHVPRTIDSLESIEELEAGAFWKEFINSTGQNRPTLYIHGYRMSFARACRHAAHLQDNLELTGRLVLFNWPSNGTALGYSKDEANVIWSIPDIRQTIDRMVEHFGPGEFNIIAHSLGARGMLDALLETKGATDANGPIVNRLILIAPDVDAGIFAQKADDVRQTARKITIYVSSKDSPLALSREVHGYPRLGQAGPHLENLRGIETIDVSDLSLSTPTGHLYHLYNDVVTDSLRKRLQGD